MVTPDILAAYVEGDRAKQAKTLLEGKGMHMYFFKDGRNLRISCYQNNFESKPMHNSNDL